MKDKRPSPTAFISYSHDSPAHKRWVKRLAAALRDDGVEVILDQWELIPGDQLAIFMERAIRDNDFVLIVCTPKYKKKSDAREGGVGYEGDVMTAEVAANSNHRKFIPLLRDGEWKDAAASWILGKVYIDLRGRGIAKIGYRHLLETIHGLRYEGPPIRVSWEVETRKAAAQIPKLFLRAHRGAILWCKGVSAIFGNRSRVEIPRLRRCLKKLGIQELGFSFSEGKHTWTMLVRSGEARMLNELTWETYTEGKGSYNDFQSQLAFEMIWNFFYRPFNDYELEVEKN